MTKVVYKKPYKHAEIEPSIIEDHKNGVSGRAISKKYDIPYISVREIMKRNNLTKPIEDYVPHNKGTDKYESIKPKIKSDRLKGLKHIELSEKYNVPFGSISKILNELDLVEHRISDDDIVLYKDIEWEKRVAKEYAKGEMRIIDIFKTYNVNGVELKYILDTHNVKYRGAK